MHAELGHGRPHRFPGALYFLLQSGLLTVCQVIIDNMMNLEVLFQSADLTGNDTLREIATTHADTTMKNHIRTDGAPPALVTGRH